MEKTRGLREEVGATEGVFVKKLKDPTRFNAREKDSLDIQFAVLEASWQLVGCMVCCALNLGISSQWDIECWKMVGLWLMAWPGYDMW